jgi:hypothetical protein
MLWQYCVRAIKRPGFSRCMAVQRLKMFWKEVHGVSGSSSDMGPGSPPTPPPSNSLVADFNDDVMAGDLSDDELDLPEFPVSVSDYSDDDCRGMTDSAGSNVIDLDIVSIDSTSDEGAAEPAKKQHAVAGVGSRSARPKRMSRKSTPISSVLQKVIAEATNGIVDNKAHKQLRIRLRREKRKQMGKKDEVKGGGKKRVMKSKIKPAMKAMKAMKAKKAKDAMKVADMNKGKTKVTVKDNADKINRWHVKDSAGMVMTKTDARIYKVWSAYHGDNGELPDGKFVKIREWEERKKLLIQLQDVSVKPMLRVATLTTTIVGLERSRVLFKTLRGMYLNGFSKQQLTKVKQNILDGCV